MTKRFLGFGINEYPNAPLRGCVADIADCCWRVTKAGWGWENMRACTDSRAPAIGITARIKHEIRKSRRVDKLLISFSGHGTQVPLRNRNSGEIDGLMEVLCPYDFDYDKPETWITDEDLNSSLRNVRNGVDCIVVLDSCFSGGMPETREASPTVVRSYPSDESLDMFVRHQAAREKKITPRGLIDTRGLDNVTFLLGCQEDQTCADAYFRDVGGYRGAFSYYFWKAVVEHPRNSRREIVEITAKMLSDAGFKQYPMIVGDNEFLLKPIL